MSRSLWSLGLSPEEIAILIAKKELTGEIFSATLRIGRLPPHGRNGGTGSPIDILSPTKGGSDGANDEAAVGPALSISRGVNLSDLKYDHCRWPIGDPQSSEFRYCGEQKGDKSRYCNKHHAIAYRPVEAIEWEE